MNPRAIQCVLKGACLALAGYALLLGQAGANSDRDMAGEIPAVEEQDDAASAPQVVALARWQPVDETTFPAEELHWLYTFTGMVQAELRLVGGTKVISFDRVMAETAAMEREGLTNMTPVQGFQILNERLESDWVVHGAMQPDGQSWTVGMRLLDREGRFVGQEFDAKGTNLFELRDQITAELLQRLAVTVSPEEREQMGKPWTTSYQALELTSRGGMLQNEGRMLPAVELFQQALAEDPGLVLARGFLATALYNLGREDEALSEARDGLRRNPDKYSASRFHLLAGLIHRNHQRTDEARQEAVEGLRVWPDSLDLLALQATLRSDVDDHEGAAASLQKAARLAPRDPKTRALLALAQFRKGEVTNALRNLELAETLSKQAQDTDDYDLLSALAQACELSGEPATALHYYHQLLAAADEANLPESRTRFVQKRVDSLERRLEPEPVEAAPPRTYSAPQLTSALKGQLSPEELALVVNPIDSTPEMARWAAEIVGDTQGDLARARRLFDHLDSRPYAGMGSTHTAQQVFSAWTDLSQSFSCQEYAKLYVALARCVGLPAFYVHVMRDYAGTPVDHDCAIIFCEGQALLVDPAYSWFGVPHQEFRVLDDIQTIAHHALQPREGESAVMTCRVALKLDPGFEWSRMALVAALIKAEQFEVARKELDVLRRADPGDAALYKLEGALACEQGRHAEGIAWLIKAKEANPHSGDIRLVLGEALFRGGQPRAARDEFMAGLRRQHGPSNEDLAQKRLRLLDAALYPEAVTPGSPPAAMDGESYYELGVSLLSGAKPEAPEGVKWMRKAAEIGVPKAQATMGVLQLTGFGTRRDITEAVGWLRKAAEAGNAEAMRNLFVVYAHTQGIKPDPAEAVRWLRRAAEAGDGYSCMLLGKTYYEGKLVPRDLVEALFWLKLAEQTKVGEGHSHASQLGPVNYQSENAALVKEVELFAGREEIDEAKRKLTAYTSRQVEIPDGRRSPPDLQPSITP